MAIMPSTAAKPEPCIWCGWLNGEHANRCALNMYLTEQAANLEFPPGPNEPGYQPPAFAEAAIKLDCPE